jgi:type IV secretory pathway TraG/TraD family ATPase VirD4
MNMPPLPPEFAEFLGFVEGLSLQDWAFIAVYVGAFAVALMVARAFIVFSLRRLGLSHPVQYRMFPRIPWRSWLLVWLNICGWRERVFRLSKQSSGGFSGALAALTHLHTPKKLLLGRAYAFGLPLLQPIGLKVSRHIKMFAMTGAGKTTLLITMLACWEGSALVVDPKGQITLALARKDKKRNWHVFDPYGVTGLPSISFNVFDVIKEAVGRSGPSAAVLWAQRIALCLIRTPEGAKTPYFYDIARGFATGLILHILTVYSESEHHLPFTRTLIIEGDRVFNAETGVEETKGNEPFLLLLDAMQRNPTFEGVIAGGASVVMNAGNETLGNILSTLQEQTKWLDVPALRACLKTSNLSLAELKTLDDQVLSLVAPVLSVREELRECFSLFINMSAYTFEAVKSKKGQCLFVVDELPSLGHNPIFEVLLPVARSQGITFVGISQDIELLKKAYPKSWESFIGNADVVIWMGSNHEATLKYLSEVLGFKTLTETDSYSGRKSYRQVRVAESDQLRRFLDPNAGRMIATRAGKRALKLVNEPYFTGLPVWAYDPDPDHKEPLLRRLMRFLLGQRPKAPAASSPQKPSTPCTDDLTPEPLITENPDE